MSHHEDYLRLEKTRDDTLKVRQRERHTYSFDDLKRKTLDVSHPGGLWPRTMANQELTLLLYQSAMSSTVSMKGQSESKQSLYSLTLRDVQCQC